MGARERCPRAAGRTGLVLGREEVCTGTLSGPGLVARGAGERERVHCVRRADKRQTGHECAQQHRPPGRAADRQERGYEREEC